MKHYKLELETEMKLLFYVLIVQFRHQNLIRWKSV